MTQARIARLSADLVANNTRFESGLARARRTMSQTRTSWQNDLNKAGKSFSNFDTHVRRSIGSVVDLRTQIGGIATVAASALSVQKIVQYSDTWKQLEGRLKIVSEDMQQVNKAQEDLFAVAQKTRQPLEGLVSFYTRLKQFVPEAERAQYNFLAVTESVASALAITGETGASSTAAMIQFTQAIGTNFESAGQEIRSLQEQAPRLAQALANSLGDGTKSLKQLQQEGVLTRQSVLRALGDLSGEARVLAEELAKIPLTVGQALTRLDNAFLKFIGQTDAIKAGTGSLALAISTLAENFEVLAKAVTGVAVVVGVRLVSSLVAAAGAMTATALGTLRVQVALAGMAGTGRVAAVSMLGLAGATTALGSAIAFLGGPIGVAIIGTLALMSQRTNAARDAQLLLNAAVADYRQAASEYIVASDERREAIRENTKANIENYKRELEAIEAIATALENENAFFRLTRRLGSKLGIDTSAEDVRGVANEVRGIINELEADLEGFDDADNRPRPTFGTGSGSSETDKVKKLIDGLKAETEELELQVSMYGQKESAITRAEKALKIQQKLEQEGINLTQKQQAEIDKYLDSLERQTELQQEQAKQQEELEQRERDRRQALNQLGASFESAFEKAITDGEKLSDVLQGLLDDILKLLTRVTITEPLGNVITDIFGGIGSGLPTQTPPFVPEQSGGGIFSGIGSFFSDIFSFASGIDYVPNDMYAKLHRGEAVMKASELQNMRGGGDVSVIINNNAGVNVSTSSRETGNGTQIDVQLDQAVADSINRKGSRSNQAVKAQMSQTLIRR